MSDVNEISDEKFIEYSIRLVPENILELLDPKNVYIANIEEEVETLLSNSCEEDYEKLSDSLLSRIKYVIKPNIEKFSDDYLICLENIYDFKRNILLSLKYVDENGEDMDEIKFLGKKLEQEGDKKKKTLFLRSEVSGDTEVNMPVEGFPLGKEIGFNGGSEVEGNYVTPEILEVDIPIGKNAFKNENESKWVLLGGEQINLGDEESIEDGNKNPSNEDNINLVQYKINMMNQKTKD